MHQSNYFEPIQIVSLRFALARIAAGKPWQGDRLFVLESIERNQRTEHVTLESPAMPGRYAYSLTEYGMVKEMVFAYGLDPDAHLGVK